MIPYTCRGCGKIPTPKQANPHSSTYMVQCESPIDACPISAGGLYVTVETWNRVFGRNPYTQSGVGPVCKCGNCAREYVGLDGCPYCMVSHKATEIGNLNITIKLLKDQLEFADRVLGQAQKRTPDNDPASVDGSLTDAYQIGALAMCHYYHGDYASEHWKNDHAGRAMRPEHIEWAKANYEPPKDEEPT